MQCIPLVKEDIDFLYSNQYFKTFIQIITDFSIKQRYYYIDLIVKDKVIEKNVFEDFKLYLQSVTDQVDFSNLTYLEEDEIRINSAIINIEKGVRGLSRFFTHGFGPNGLGFSGQFTDFILMKNNDLGKMKYLLPKPNPDLDYAPIKARSLRGIKISLISKSKIILAKDFDSWPLKTKRAKLIFNNLSNSCLIQIDGEIFGLNGRSKGKFKVPSIHSSKFISPRKVNFKPKLIDLAFNL